MIKRLAIRRCLAVAAAIVCCTLGATAQDQHKKVRIIQTNSAGDNIHLIDPATNKVVGVIEGIEVNHGVGGAPDGSRIYISDEAMSTLDVVDAKSLKVIKRIQNPDLPPGKATVPQGSDPSHGMAVTSDGKTLVVCSRLNNYLYFYSLPDLKVLGGAELGGKGAAWVTLTPDGKTAYVANPVTNDVSVVDVTTRQVLKKITVGERPWGLAVVAR